MRCWEERTLASLPAGHRMERRCCPMAFATRRPCLSTAQRCCLGGVAACAAGSAEGSGSSRGISRDSCSHGPDPALAILLLPPPCATQPSQARQVSLGGGLGPSAQGESIHALPAMDLQANPFGSLAPCPRAWTVPSEGRSERALPPRCT